MSSENKGNYDIMNKPANILVPALLFVLLSPGLFLTIPAGKSGKVFRSGETSLESILVHALVFVVLYYVIRKLFPDFY
jgi:hypothetical protein